MRKLLVALATALVVGLGAGASSADAHYVMHSYDAQTAGRAVARSDCGRAWDWTCFNFPISGPTVWGCTEHTWCVRTWYTEMQIYSFGRRTCYTDAHYTHGALSYRRKLC